MILADNFDGLEFWGFTIDLPKAAPDFGFFIVTHF